MDKSYWNSYYNRTLGNLEPSSFARAMLQHIPEDGKILELGCGNGRDAIYFSSQGYRVLACDQSEVIIRARADAIGSSSLQFFVADIANMPDLASKNIDVVYTRFVLHALSAAEAANAFAWIYSCMNSGGLFLSESRSTRDPIFGQGQRVAEHVYRTDHRRRFLDRKSLESDLEGVGFELLEVVEEQGLAIYKDDDPVVIRVIARKP